MELSVKDLILKPETPGLNLLRPSVLGSGQAASMAVFNDLLGQFGQTHRNNIADRPTERETSAVSDASPRPARIDSPRQDAGPARHDPEPEASPVDGRAEHTALPSQGETKAPADKTQAPAANPEGDQANQAAPANPAVEAAGQPANATPSQSAMVPTEFLNPVAQAAVTAAHDHLGGRGQTAPGQAVAAAVASAVASAAANRAAPSASAPAPVDLPATAKALGLNSVVGTVGTGAAPEPENLPFQGQGNGKNTAATTQYLAPSTIFGYTLGIRRSKL